MSVLKYLYGEEIAEQFTPRRRFTLGQSPPKLVEKLGNRTRPKKKPSVNDIAGWAQKHYEKMDTPYTIGISPNDKLLSKMEEVEISKQLATAICYLWDNRFITGAIIVGEYSPQWRWHYHGYISFKQGKALSLARRLLSLEGLARVVISKVQIFSFVKSEYLFKTYMKTDLQLKNKHTWKAKNGTMLDGRNIITTFKIQDDINDNKEYEDILERDIS